MFKIRAHQKDWTKALVLAERINAKIPNEPTVFYFARLVHKAGEINPKSAIPYWNIASA